MNAPSLGWFRKPIEPDQVTFLGWVNPKEVSGFFASSEVGVILHNVNTFTNTVVSNKIFNYISVVRRSFLFVLLRLRGVALSLQVSEIHRCYTGPVN